MQPRAGALALLAICSCGPLGARAVALVSGRAGRAPRQFREGQANLVMPLAFEQRLLICNAYPSGFSMSVRKNDHEPLTAGEDGISFRQCRNMATEVQKQDKLVFQLKDQAVEGTFEVGDLPMGDSMLLLVLGRRPASPLIAFSSFAFPSGTEAGEAQLAVIDAFAGNSSMAHVSARLRVEGREGGAAQQQSGNREEELHFNRVYMIEEGTYNASVVETSNRSASRLSRQLKLGGRGNYVVLNAGDGGEFPQLLTVFPEEPLQHSGGWRQALASPCVAILMLTASLCLL